MKTTNLFRSSIIFSLFLSLGLTQDVMISFGEMSDGTLEVYMDNSAPIAGFQFNVSGVSLTGGSGGSAQSAGFMVSTSSTTAIGFSLTGSTIPAGSGLLTTLEFVNATGDDVCLSDAVMSGSGGTSLSVGIGDCYEAAPTVSTIEVMYSSEEDIAGFQFDVEGVSVLSAAGGDATANGFMISASSTTVIGFSLMGTVIPAGSGVLCVLEVEGNVDDACLGALVLSGPGGSGLDASVEGCNTITYPAPPQISTVDITYNSIEDIAGFQFDVNGVSVLSGSGGDSEANGFMVSTSSTTVIGFSLMGTVIPAGSGTLLSLEVEGDVDQLCISDLVLSGPGGAGLEATINDCNSIVYNGCTDEDSDGVCDDIDDCIGEFDECGICNGDGIPNGFCDCDGNEFDCAGVCGGDAEFDDCGECGGDGSGCGVTLSFGNVADGTMEILMLAGADVYGFQFNVPGATITGDLGGGSAESNGFMVSTSSTTVIGFSLTGSSIPAGESTLLTLTYDALTSEACIDAGVVSGVGGSGLTVSYGDCVALGQPVDGCTDESADNYNPDATDDDGSCEYTVELSFGELDEDSGTLEIYMENPAAVSGFQFDVTGIDASGASGGSAESNGFQVSTNGTTAIGFSLTGSSIPAGGEALLTTLSFSDGGGDVCLSNILITSTSFGFHNSIGPDDCLYIEEEILGCTDDAACNYNPSANSDDGSCEYELDCEGTCGGDSELDECGICNGDCAAYIESSITTSISDEDLADLDAFSDSFELLIEDELGLPEGSVEVTNITVLNRDTDVEIEFSISLTEEELDNAGNIEDLEEALEEVVSDIEDNGLPGDSDVVSYSVDLHGGANLVSFWALPSDISVANVMSSLGTNATGVIGEGVAASQIAPGNWVGSLSNISVTSGYWVKVNSSGVIELAEATPTDAGTVYDLHSGANLISFPFEGTIGISAGIPDDVEGEFTGIIGEGVAASQIAPGNWVGSLSGWSGTKGYWAKVDNAVTFSFNAPGLMRSEEFLNESPYEYVQSTEQAFYFVEDIVGAEYGDWILAYNNNELVGAREWNGMYTDIPAMGNDGSVETSGYCNTGDIPTFYLVKEYTGEQIELTGALTGFESNAIYTVDSLSEVVVPNAVSLSPAYPNPFNPETTLEYSVETSGMVELSIFDINGRLVSTLYSGELSSGNYTASWDASDQPSGLYIAQLTSGITVQTTKLVLLK